MLGELEVYCPIGIRNMDNLRILLLLITKVKLHIMKVYLLSAFFFYVYPHSLYIFRGCIAC